MALLTRMRKEAEDAPATESKRTKRTPEKEQPAAASDARTMDEVRELLNQERQKLNALHKQREQIHGQFADYLLDRSLGRAVDADEVVRLSAERESLDAQIDDQESIVQRFEDRLWEFQEAAGGTVTPTRPIDAVPPTIEEFCERLG